VTSTAVRLSIVDSARPAVAAQLDVVLLSTVARVTRALRFLGTVWAFALLSVLVPLLHFVLVPGLLLLGLVAGALGFKSRVRAEAGSGVACPKCASGVQLEGARYGWPLRLDCRTCSAAISARPA
jgi:hypothetical protein